MGAEIVDLFDQCLFLRLVAGLAGGLLLRLRGGDELLRAALDERLDPAPQARELLGYAPEHSWRDVLADPGATG